MITKENIKNAEKFSEAIAILREAFDLNEVEFVLAFKVGARSCDVAFPEETKIV